jgi:ribonuclease P/MRP protein subunit POP3
LWRLLEPIGNHRRTHITPSKGKRSKKRKREEAKQNGRGSMDVTPDPPEILRHITVGLNSTSRHLEEMTKYSSRAKTKTQLKDKPAHPTPSPLAVVFLTAPPTSLPYSHLPTLCALASENHPSGTTPLLIPLHATSTTTSFETPEAQLASALGIPRVGVVAVLDTAINHGAKGLLEHCKENLEPVDVPWLREARAGKWMGTKIGLEGGVGGGRPGGEAEPGGGVKEKRPENKKKVERSIKESEPEKKQKG